MNDAISSSSSKHEIEDAMYRGRPAPFFDKNYCDAFNHLLVNYFMDKRPDPSVNCISCALIGDKSPLIMISGVPMKHEGQVGDFNYSRMRHVTQVFNPETRNAVRLCLAPKTPQLFIVYLSQVMIDISDNYHIYSAWQDRIEVMQPQLVTGTLQMLKIQNHLVWGETLENTGAACAIH